MYNHIPLRYFFYKTFNACNYNDEQPLEDTKPSPMLLYLSTRAAGVTILNSPVPLVFKYSNIPSTVQWCGLDENWCVQHCIVAITFGKGEKNC